MSETAATTSIQTTTPPSANGQTAIAKPSAPLPLSKAGVVLADIEGLWRFARIVHASGFAPKGMNIEAVAIAIQMGLEVGLSPMQAIQSTAVINGRPGIFGDAAKALVEASGLLEDFDEWYEVAGQRVERTPSTASDDLTAVCMSKRVGRRAIVSTFSIADAKIAQLWGKAGPWTQYWLRMLRWRARGFNLRDNFGDVLKGLRTVEEIQDAPSNYVDAVAASDEAPKTGVAALSEKLRERSANVAPSNGHGLPSGEEPNSPPAVHEEIKTDTSTNGDAKTETADTDAGDKPTTEQIAAACNQLDQWLEEAGDVATLDSVIDKSKDDLATIHRYAPEAFEKLTATIQQRRTALTAEKTAETQEASPPASSGRARRQTMFADKT